LDQFGVEEAGIEQALGRGLNPRSSSVLTDRQSDAVRGLFPRAVLTDEERRRELESLGWDLRVFDHRAIARRYGQPAFRRELLSAYQNRCAVTGSTTVDVLEAAHISPYRGEHTNVVQNGLLLRSDVHTLFDLGKLTVLPSLTVAVHPDLREGEYKAVHGQELAVTPSDLTSLPDPELLKKHNANCRWLLA
ncbi:MAG TPA: HNH endonuclease, partial [Intrasporangium sp.]|nr:HNH endonuclease [Intrasporangium sp.]